MNHALRILPENYKAVKEGRQTFIVRLDDRGFNVGDIVILHEYDGINFKPTQPISKEITYILNIDFPHIKTLSGDGYVVLALGDTEKRCENCHHSDYIGANGLCCMLNSDSVLRVIEEDDVNTCDDYEAASDSEIISRLRRENMRLKRNADKADKLLDTLKPAKEEHNLHASPDEYELLRSGISNFIVARGSKRILKEGDIANIFEFDGRNVTASDPLKMEIESVHNNSDFKWLEIGYCFISLKQID